MQIPMLLRNNGYAQDLHRPHTRDGNDNWETDIKNKISTEKFHLLPQNNECVSEFRRFHELQSHKAKVQVRIKKYMSRGMCIGQLLSFQTQLSQDVEYERELNQCLQFKDLAFSDSYFVWEISIFQRSGKGSHQNMSVLFWKWEKVSSVPESMLDFYKGIKLVHWVARCYWNYCLNRLLFHVSEWNRSRSMLFYYQSVKELRSL